MAALIRKPPPLPFVATLLARVHQVPHAQLSLTAQALSFALTQVLPQPVRTGVLFRAAAVPAAKPVSRSTPRSIRGARNGVFAIEGRRLTIRSSGPLRRALLLSHGARQRPLSSGVSHLLNVSRILGRIFARLG